METQTEYLEGADMNEEEKCYQFKEFYIRPQMMGAIRRYIDEGLEPGAFLVAVICNDLAGACDRADSENLRNLPAFVAYFYNKAPSACWRSRERMKNWMADKRMEAKS